MFVLEVFAYIASSYARGLWVRNTYIFTSDTCIRAQDTSGINVIKDLEIQGLEIYLQSSQILEFK